jgi:hypothetical protein
MKKIHHILGLLLILFSCSDGDLITQDFSFGLAEVKKCASTSTLFKINAQQALILNIAESNFPNVETALNTPRIVNVAAGTSIQYRKYSGNVTSASICDSPAPSNPTVQEEWNVIGGTIEITTKKVLDSNNIVIIGYNHNIVFRNVTFVGAGKQIAYETYDFGNYRTSVIVLPFNFATSSLLTCSTNLKYKYNDKEALLLQIDPTIFSKDNSSKSVLIDGSNCSVSYRIYNGSLNASFFCTAIPPVAPALVEEWIAVNGVATLSGIVKVENTIIVGTPNHFKHVIKFYKTTFKKGVQTYNPAVTDDYFFGEFTE